MEFKINNKDKANKLCILFQNSKEFTDHVILYVSKDGVYIQGLDKSNVCLYEIKIPKEWFDIYNYTSNREKLLLGIHNEMLYKIINTKENEQIVHFNYEDDSDKLNITFLKNIQDENDKNDDSKNIVQSTEKFFELSLIDLEESLLEIPDNEYSIDIKLPTKYLHNLCNHLATFHEDVQINCIESDDTFDLIANGNMANMSVSIDTDDLNEYSVEEDYSFKQLFGLEYFKLMLKFHNLSDELYLGFSNNLPMKMQYTFDEATLSFYLAPKIGENNED